MRNKAELKSVVKGIRDIKLQAPIFRTPVFHIQLSKVDPMMLIGFSVFALDEVLLMEPDSSTWGSVPERVGVAVGPRRPAQAGPDRLRAGEGAGDGA